MSDSVRPRRPGRVVALVAAFWIVGTLLQSLFGWLAASSGLVEPETSVRVGQVTGWGLLFVLSLVYREQIDRWLRA